MVGRVSEAIACDMRVHGKNYRPCDLRVIPGGVLRERPETHQEHGFAGIRRARTVYGPSSLVGAQVGRCGRTKESGRHACCSVVSVAKL